MVKGGAGALAYVAFSSSNLQPNVPKEDGTYLNKNKGPTEDWTKTNPGRNTEMMVRRISHSPCPHAYASSGRQGATPSWSSGITRDF